MRYNNTTDIPDNWVIAAYRHAIQPNVSINEVELRNKKEGIQHGRLGAYYNWNKSIRLVVPRIDVPQTYNLTYSKRTIHIANRMEFVVAVLAHELRHAWQWQASNDMEYFSGPLSAQTLKKELDAETYELERLKSWRIMFGEVANQAFAAHKRGK
jgi:hypothetical protein